MKIKIEMTHANARKYREVLDQKRGQLQAELEEVVRDIADLDSHLGAKLTLADQFLASVRNKRKKGENLLAIKKYLASELAGGATVAEISYHTKIPHSSCDAVLNNERNHRLFSKNSEGRWFFRTSSLPKSEE
jgi:vacuolar-type H+-ATPase subunit D/Vma8